MEYTPTGEGVIMVKPGSGMPNGVSRHFAVTGMQQVMVQARGSAVGGTAKMFLRAVFKDASGTTLSTHTVSQTIAGPTHMIGEWAVPSGAVVAEVIWAAGDPSSSTAFVGFTAMGCLMAPSPIGMDWNETEGECPIDEEEEEPESCNVSCDGFECDISCPEGQAVFETCAVDPVACQLIAQCYCVVGGGEVSDQFTKIENYANW